MYSYQLREIQKQSQRGQWKKVLKKLSRDRNLASKMNGFLMATVLRGTPSPQRGEWVDDFLKHEQRGLGLKTPTRGLMFNVVAPPRPALMLEKYKTSSWEEQLELLVSWATRKAPQARFPDVWCRQATSLPITPNSWFIASKLVPLCVRYLDTKDTAAFPSYFNHFASAVPPRWSEALAAMSMLALKQQCAVRPSALQACRYSWAAAMKIMSLSPEDGEGPLPPLSPEEKELVLAALRFRDPSLCAIVENAPCSDRGRESSALKMYLSANPTKWYLATHVAPQREKSRLCSKKKLSGATRYTDSELEAVMPTLTNWRRVLVEFSAALAAPSRMHPRHLRKIVQAAFLDVALPLPLFPILENVLHTASSHLSLPESVLSCHSERIAQCRIWHQALGALSALISCLSTPQRQIVLSPRTVSETIQLAARNGPHHWSKCLSLFSMTSCVLTSSALSTLARLLPDGAQFDATAVDIYAELRIRNDLTASQLVALAHKVLPRCCQWEHGIAVLNDLISVGCVEDSNLNNVISTCQTWSRALWTLDYCRPAAAWRSVLGATLKVLDERPRHYATFVETLMNKLFLHHPEDIPIQVRLEVSEILSSHSLWSLGCFLVNSRATLSHCLIKLDRATQMDANLEALHPMARLENQVLKALRSGAWASAVVMVTAHMRGSRAHSRGVRWGTRTKLSPLVESLVFLLPSLGRMGIMPRSLFEDVVLDTMLLKRVGRDYLNSFIVTAVTESSYVSPTIISLMLGRRASWVSVLHCWNTNQSFKASGEVLDYLFDRMAVSAGKEQLLAMVSTCSTIPASVLVQVLHRLPHLDGNDFCTLLGRSPRITGKLVYEARVRRAHPTVIMESIASALSAGAVIIEPELVLDELALLSPLPKATARALVDHIASSRENSRPVVKKLSSQDLVNIAHNASTLFNDRALAKCSKALGIRVEDLPTHDLPSGVAPESETKQWHALVRRCVLGGTSDIAMSRALTAEVIRQTPVDHFPSLPVNNFYGFLPTRLLRKLVAHIPLSSLRQTTHEQLRCVAEGILTLKQHRMSQFFCLLLAPSTASNFLKILFLRHLMRLHSKSVKGEVALGVPSSIFSRVQSVYDSQCTMWARALATSTSVAAWWMHRFRLTSGLCFAPTMDEHTLCMLRWIAVLIHSRRLTPVHTKCVLRYLLQKKLWAAALRMVHMSRCSARNCSRALRNIHGVDWSMAVRVAVDCGVLHRQVPYAFSNHWVIAAKLFNQLDFSTFSRRQLVHYVRALAPNNFVQAEATCLLLSKFPRLLWKLSPKRTMNISTIGSARALEGLSFAYVHFHQWQSMLRLVQLRYSELAHTQWSVALMRYTTWDTSLHVLAASLSSGRQLERLSVDFLQQSIIHNRSSPFIQLDPHFLDSRSYQTMMKVDGSTPWVLALNRFTQFRATNLTVGFDTTTPLLRSYFAANPVKVIDVFHGLRRRCFGPTGRQIILRGLVHVAYWRDCLTLLGAYQNEVIPTTTTKAIVQLLMHRNVRHDLFKSAVRRMLGTTSNDVTQTRAQLFQHIVTNPKHWPYAFSLAATRPEGELSASEHRWLLCCVFSAIDRNVMSEGAAHIDRVVELSPQHWDPMTWDLLVERFDFQNINVQQRFFVSWQAACGVLSSYVRREGSTKQTAADSARSARQQYQLLQNLTTRSIPHVQFDTARCIAVLQILNGSVHNQHLCNSFIRTLSETNWETAIRVATTFAPVHPHVVTQLCRLVSFRIPDKWLDALALCNSVSISAASTPSSFTAKDRALLAASMLNVLRQNWAVSLSVYRSQRALSMLPDFHVFRSLMRNVANAGQWEVCFALLPVAHSWRVPTSPTLLCFTVFACLKARPVKWEHALLAFERRERSRWDKLEPPADFQRLFVHTIQCLCSVQNTPLIERVLAAWGNQVPRRAMCSIIENTKFPHYTTESLFQLMNKKKGPKP
eukprot:PhM_4_TR9798/c0_g1_i1/m.24057